jgi:ankyrin repeat protein
VKPASWTLALLQAAEQDDAAQAALLLKKHASPNASRGDQTTPLHWAAYNDDLPLVKLAACIRSGARSAHPAACLTPLHMAAESGDAALIEVLVEGGSSKSMRQTIPAQLH